MTDNYSVKEAIRIAVLTLPGKKWPTYDGGELTRWQYVSASEASKCVRQLGLVKADEAKAVAIPDFWNAITDEEFQQHLDAMGPDDKRGIFERGNLIEEWAVRRLLESAMDDEEYLFVGDGQVSFYTNKKRVSGTGDGIYVNHSTMTWRPIEFKSSNSPVTAPKYGNQKQVLVNMGLLQFLISEGLVDEAIDFPLSSYTMLPGQLLYINSDNFLMMDEFEVPYDDGVEFSKAFAKAKALFIVKDGKVSLRDPSELAPEGLNTPNGCWFCPKRGECRAIEEAKHDAANIARLQAVSDRISGVGPVPKMPEFRSLKRTEALAALTHYYRFKQEEKQAKKNAAAIKEAIQKWCDDENISAKVKFQDADDVFEVAYTKGARIGSIDAEKLNAFLEAHGMVERDGSFRKPTTASSRLTVKVTPEEAYRHRDLAKLIADGDDDEEEGEEE